MYEGMPLNDHCLTRQPVCDGNSEHEYVVPSSLLEERRSRIPCVLSIMSVMICTAVLILTIVDLFTLERSQCEREPAVTSCNASAPSVSHLIMTDQQEKPSLSDPTERMRDTNVKFTPASAHKGILAPDIYSKTSDGHFYARFNTSFNEPLLEHDRGVVVEETSLKVRYSGLYYIYCGLHYRPNFTTSADALLYYISRHSQNDPANTGTLLSGMHTPDSGCHKHSKTAYTGGVFHLKGGDQIQVCLSKPDLVEFITHSTFLGLIMLGSG